MATEQQHITEIKSKEKKIDFSKLLQKIGPNDS